MRLYSKILSVIFLSSSINIAHASDWGCRVLLCLSNPAGPEAVSECVPPIEALWNALDNGDPFPTCDEMGSPATGNYGNNTWASSSYCHPSLVTAQNVLGQTIYSCSAQGAINIVINGSPNTRVWWGIPSATGKTTLLESVIATPDHPAAPLINPATATQIYAASHPQCIANTGIGSFLNLGGAFIGGC